MTTGFLGNRHQIRKPSDGIVSCFGGGKVPYVPPGYDYSIQLGNWNKGSEWERLRTNIRVSENNSLLEINMAIFLEDPSHNTCQQPRFYFRIYNQANQIVSCGDYQVIAGSDLPNWETSYCSGFSPVRYLPWTKVGIDLRKYLGQIIKLEFQTMDCSEGAHFG